ncbi:Enoyl-CoA isomerase/hydratase fer4 [Seminavis robusta]|uniref:Enoyl-CoA isomerase/hydratase fer4 n=1 Tax=Seminavis robusta TaxID=568900 RepID=A0A9N8EX74_9STRA|nr:Enoyl-CoA isomerase/hydratase fer4 [Seminavis robusta]|eukprot:Sro2125_g315680.1 Enoyl-CoA isomerase/hydratase fer4 (326) ;mRNA; r:13020-13997
MIRSLHINRLLPTSFRVGAVAPGPAHPPVAKRPQFCYRYNNATTTRRWIATNDITASGKQIILDHQAHENDPNAIVTTITLNRPKANAMGSIMLKEFQDCLADLEDTDTQKTRCVVLTSYSHKVFSAGADLKERATMTQGEAADFVTNLRNTMERMAQLPIPVIAAVEGVAVGGGLEICLAADIRIASGTASFGLPETSLAIIPGAGGTQRLPRLLGSVARAKELIWTGRRISAQEAYEYGLVQHVVDPEKALEKAMELSWKIALNGPVAIRASKQAIEEGMAATDMKEALEIERQNYAKVLPTDDRLEGLSAFKEGRTPEYKGQ